MLHLELTTVENWVDFNETGVHYYSFLKPTKLTSNLNNRKYSEVLPILQPLGASYLKCMTCL